MSHAVEGLKLGGPERVWEQSTDELVWTRETKQQKLNIIAEFKHALSTRQNTSTDS
jgi:hypothetical protein